MAGGLSVINDVSKNDDLPPRALDQSRAGKSSRLRKPSTNRPAPSCARTRPTRIRSRPTSCSTRSWTLYVEENLGAEEIAARGFDEKTVRWILRKVDLNEYKRAQAVPGPESHQPRVSASAGGFRSRRNLCSDRLRRLLRRRVLGFLLAEDWEKIVGGVEFRAISAPGALLEGHIHRTQLVGKIFAAGSSPGRCP